MLSQISTLIRQKLGCKPTDSLFIYIRSSFAPPPDARIADLFDVRQLAIITLPILELRH